MVIGLTSCVRHAARLRPFGSLSPRGTSGERVGERGKLIKSASSPLPSPPFEEERERNRGCALNANLLPNTTAQRAALRKIVAARDDLDRYWKSALQITPRR